MIRRCLEEGIYPIGATRTLVLEAVEAPVLIVWMGIEWVDNGGILHPDRTDDGIKYVKSDLANRIDFAGRSIIVGFAHEKVLEQMGLTVGKISPLDFIDRPLPSSYTYGLFIVSNETLNLVAERGRAHPDLDVIIPSGPTGVMTLKVGELVHGRLGGLDSEKWMVVI